MNKREQFITDLCNNFSGNYNFRIVPNGFVLYSEHFTDLELREIERKIKQDSKIVTNELKIESIAKGSYTDNKIELEINLLTVCS